MAQDEDALSLALYIDAEVLERLGRRDPFALLDAENLGDYLTVAEGVSHFVYVAWNAGFDKPVTLLELELQAEVDKYVLCAWLLREQGAGRFPGELHRVLFERARIDPTAAAGRARLYHTASSYGGRFCRRVAASLARGTRGAHAASCSRSCGVSIAGVMRASCATSSASRSASSGYSASGSGSPEDLRASISRFSLIHSPSLRRSRFPPRASSVRARARRRCAHTDRNPKNDCVRPKAWRSRRGPVSARC